MRIQIIVFTFLNCIGFIQLYAQKGDKSISPMMLETEKHIDSIEHRFDLNRIIKVEIDQVKSSSSGFNQVKLTGGRRYGFFLLGESGKIKDIDLKIHQKVVDKSIEVKYENSLSNIVDTSFEPENTDLYELEIIAQEFLAGYSEGLYSLIISF